MIVTMLPLVLGTGFAAGPDGLVRRYDIAVIPVSLLLGTTSLRPEGVGR
jgi:hypothetical protein